MCFQTTKSTRAFAVAVFLASSLIAAKVDADVVPIYGYLARSPDRYMYDRRDNLAKQGWRSLGITFYALPPAASNQGLPIHGYLARTPDRYMYDLRNNLGKQGWQSLGVAFTATTPDVVIPLASNGYIEPHEKYGTYGTISNNGVGGWISSEGEIKVYFLAKHAGDLKLAVQAKAPDSDSFLQVKCADVGSLGSLGKDIRVSRSNDYRNIPVGTFSIKKAGYQQVTITGNAKSGGTYYPDVRSLVLSGPAARDVVFNSSRYRTAPAVHLRYPVPGNPQVDTFYSELTIPKGSDHLNSYYMANGFSGGYFGIQVNSPTERRVLFSVWSTFKTNDSSKIPADQRVLLLKKGPGVTTNDFDNEGAGGQSYLKFNWQTGTTYKFLVRASRNEREKSNTYTAHIYTPETKSWRLIATWKQQKSNSRPLSGLYSFVEEFGAGTTGNRKRYGLFGNQWVRRTDGQWVELARAGVTTTADSTKHPRFDVGGESAGGGFGLYSGGFKDYMLPLRNVQLTRRPGVRPILPDSLFD